MFGPTPPPLTAPVWLQLGDGARKHLGEVMVSLDTHTRTGDPADTPVLLGVVDTALLSDQVAALLEHAARTLRKEAI